MPLDAARDGLIAVQGQLIAVLAAQNAALAGRAAQPEAANAGLAERLARLERALSRNPGSSSVPHPADDLPGKTPPPQRRQPRREGKKRPGKQPGAPGAHLAWSEDPQRTVPVLPQGGCACGRDLAAAAGLGVAASHQVIGVRWSPRRSRSTTGMPWDAAAAGCTPRPRRRMPGPPGR